MARTPADLWVDDLTVEYALGGHVSRPLDHLSFAAEGGQIVLALGPSGCGKTTLLSVLAGLLRPASGRVAFGGTDVTALEGRDLLHHRRKSVGTVFQTFNLIRSLSALENVMAPLILTGTRKGSARSVAMRLLEELSLADHAGKRPGELSGGQQQRVAFARALVHDPPLLLADEPTAHLDPGQVARILDLVGRMRTPDRLVVIATHDRRFEDVADGVVWMEQAAGRPAGERR